MLKQPDILEILGITGREDSFTNFIKYLFDNNEDFKDKFSKKFLNIDETRNIEDSILLTRSSYILEVNQRIIPDMVLYSRSLNRISIIEVKVHSGQGKDQLERYKNNIGSITSLLKLDSDVEDEYYYLSINDDLKDGQEWKHVKWEDMQDIFKVESPREDVNNIIEAVKDRINSTKYKLVYEEVKDKLFNNYLIWNLWKSPGKAIEQIILSNEDLSDSLNINGYTNFAPASNTIETTIIISKEDWKSELEYGNRGSSINNCYDFHIEIRISIAGDIAQMTIRLDHHLNPYIPNKLLKNSDKYDEIYNGRREFIKEIKYKKYKDMGQEKDYKYNKATGSYLWIISKSGPIRNSETVENVLKFINEEIIYLSGKIEILKDEVINFKI